jgi:hypothetical protein
MEDFIPHAALFLFFARPGGEYVKQIKVSNIAHIFSMRTNGLSVKPCDRHLLCGVNHSRRTARENFLQPCPAVGNLFAALLARSTDNREIRRLQAQPAQAPGL